MFNLYLSHFTNIELRDIVFVLLNKKIAYTNNIVYKHQNIFIKKKLEIMSFKHNSSCKLYYKCKNLFVFDLQNC